MSRKKIKWDDVKARTYEDRYDLALRQMTHMCKVFPDLACAEGLQTPEMILNPIAYDLWYDFWNYVTEDRLRSRTLAALQQDEDEDIRRMAAMVYAGSLSTQVTRKIMAADPYLHDPMMYRQFIVGAYYRGLFHVISYFKKIIDKDHECYDFLMKVYKKMKAEKRKEL
jgi:hypothetical protein